MEYKPQGRRVRVALPEREDRIFLLCLTNYHATAFHIPQGPVISNAENMDVQLENCHSGIHCYSFYELLWAKLSAFDLYEGEVFRAKGSD